MGIAALVFGILGGICAVLGGLTVGDVIPQLATGLTATTWFILSGILLLVCIAFNTGRSKSEY